MPPGVKVAYVVRSWPRLSQTFVLNEILALERIGVKVGIFAMTSADEAIVQPQVADVRAAVNYLDRRGARRAGAHVRVAAAVPLRYLTTCLFALTRRGLLGGYTQSSGLQAFDRAVRLTDRLRSQEHGAPFSHIHAHFAHDPALLGLLAHRLTGLSFTFTAHARDLHQIPRSALRGRAREASAVVTCCRTNLEYVGEVLGNAGPPVELIYHGIDLQVFRPAAERPPRDVPVVVTVGRLVEKKGFDNLLHACALLAGQGRAFTCEIYGEGPCRPQLEALRDRLGLGGIVQFCGSRTQMELVSVYQQADVFALTPRVMEDGDRDGVPNVILEAMACGVPIVSTPVGGVGEVLAHDAEGLLAQPDDPHALAACLERLLADADRRRSLGDAAALRATGFDTDAAAHRLAELFGRDPQAVA